MQLDCFASSQSCYETLSLRETAYPLAYADRPLFGQWSIIAENAYGKGNFFFIGTYPLQELLEKVIRLAAEKAGVITSKKRCTVSGNLSLR